MLRRGLLRCLAAVVLLPVALSVVLGLGGLLGALGDGAGAAVCGRLALGLGVLFVVAIAAATALNALVILVPRGRPARRRRGRRRARRAAGPALGERPLGPS